MDLKEGLTISLRKVSRHLENDDYHNSSQGDDPDNPSGYRMLVFLHKRHRRPLLLRSHVG